MSVEQIILKKVILDETRAFYDKAKSLYTDDIHGEFKAHTA